MDTTDDGEDSTGASPAESRPNEPRPGGARLGEPGAEETAAFLPGPGDPVPHGDYAGGPAPGGHHLARVPRLAPQPPVLGRAAARAGRPGVAGDPAAVSGWLPRLGQGRHLHRHRRRVRRADRRPAGRVRTADLVSPGAAAFYAIAGVLLAVASFVATNLSASSSACCSASPGPRSASAGRRGLAGPAGSTVRGDRAKPPSGGLGLVLGPGPPAAGAAGAAGEPGARVALSRPAGPGRRTAPPTGPTGCSGRPPILRAGQGRPIATLGG